MSSNYYTQLVFNQTLTELCRSYNVQAQDVIRINTQRYSETETVAQLLTRCQISGERIPDGVLVRIPYANTGGRELNYSEYDDIIYSVNDSVISSEDMNYNVNNSVINPGDTDYNVNNSVINPGDTDYNVKSVKNKIKSTKYKIKGVVKESDSFKFTLKKPSKHKLLSTVTDSWTEFNCYVIVYAAGGEMGSMNLPVYPQEFSDSNDASFNETPIFGRSVPYQTYNNSGRAVSLNLQLHEELCSDYDYIHQLVAFIESACYPEYGGGNQVSPPEIRIVIGSQFSCRGILTNCSASWKAPIIDGRHVNCDLSIGIKETTGPYGMSNISGMGGLRNV